MGYISMGIVIFTIASVVLGALFGIFRGLNRSLLKLGFVIISAILAVVLRGVAYDIVMGINIGGQTINEVLLSMVSQSGSTMPENIQNLLFSLIEILVGLIIYFVLFFAFNLILGGIVYLICKIFVPKNEGPLKYVGAAVGAVQGLIIAILVCAPLSGILVEADKLSKAKANGQPLFSIPAEIGIEEYVNSPTNGFYNGVGGWFYKSLTTTTDANGKTVSLSDTCDVFIAIMGVADTVNNLGSGVDVMTKPDATAKEKTQAMKDIGDKLTELDNSVNGLSDDAKVLVNDLVTSVAEMVGGESEEGKEDAENQISAVLESFDINQLKLSSAGESLKGIATYIEKTNTEEFGVQEPFTQEEADVIINGFAENQFMIGVISQGETTPQLISVSDEHKDMFYQSIENSTLSVEDKATLEAMLGITRQVA